VKSETGRKERRLRGAKYVKEQTMKDPGKNCKLNK
jgi:hypothetical protein